MADCDCESAESRAAAAQTVHDFEGHGGKEVQLIEMAGPPMVALDAFDISCCVTWWG